MRRTREPMHLVNRVRIVECGDPMVDLGEHCPNLLLRGRPMYARRRIADMLNEADAHLPDGTRFLVVCGYRTLSEQQRMYWRYYRQLRKDHPAWPENILRRQTNRYVAPPDAKAPPGHCTGGAVDITVADERGVPLDMTAPYSWPEKKSNATYAPCIDGTARRNRRILIRALSAVRFSNCADEWWHWSYGDSAWAVRVGRRVAIFGLVEVPGYEGPRITADWNRRPLQRPRLEHAAQ